MASGWYLDYLLTTITFPTLTCRLWLTSIAVFGREMATALFSNLLIQVSTCFLVRSFYRRSRGSR